MSKDHDPIAYIAIFNDRIEYNFLLMDYLGEDVYKKAADLPVRPKLDEEHEFVTRESILQFIADKQKPKW